MYPPAWEKLNQQSHAFMSVLEHTTRLLFSLRFQLSMISEMNNFVGVPRELTYQALSLF